MYISGQVLSIPLKETNDPYILQEVSSRNIVEVLSTENVDYDLN